MQTKIYARESVAFDQTIVVRDSAGAAVDITGWSFTVQLMRQAGAPELTLGTVTAGSEGFTVADGPNGSLRMRVEQATLAGIPDTTGDFTMFGDLLGTPPGGEALLVGDLRLNITDAGVDFLGASYSIVLNAVAASVKAELEAIQTTAVNASTAALALTNFRSTYADGIADFAVGEFFSTAESGALRIYKRIASAPYYEDQGDAVAPLTYDNAEQVVATRAALDDAPMLGVAYVVENKARYQYIAVSVATDDGWTVRTPTGGAGRWHLLDAELTVAPSGGDDSPALMAAGNALAAAGKALRAEPDLYLLNTQWSWPASPLVVHAARETEFRCGLTPDASPSNAAFFCTPGGAALVQASTLAAAAGAASGAVSLNHAPTVGQYVRMRNTSSGDGFTGATYIVRAVSGAGPFTVTLDRPMRFALAAGDEADIFSDIPKGHRILGFPKVTGSGTRLFEFICTHSCWMQVRFHPDNINDVVASFDTFGFFNHFAPGTECYENGSGATDGLYLESNERSSVEARVEGFTGGVGVSIFHGIDCVDRSTCTGNNDGAALRGYLGNGCIGSKLAGSYNGNANVGAGIFNGSADCAFTGEALYNPTNLQVGDGGGGNVSNSYVGGDLRGATSIALLVDATAIGTHGGAVKTGDSPSGIVANGPLALALHSHRGSVDVGAGVIVAAAPVDIATYDYNITNVANVIRTSSDAVVSLGGGNAVATAGSNFANLSGTSQLNLLGGKVTIAGGIGIYFAAAGASATIGHSADLSGVATPFSGSGTVHRPEKPLYKDIGASNTTAVTTEEVLKTYTLGTRDLSAGSAMRTRAFGTFAANGNTKTVNFNLGGATLEVLSGAFNGEDWLIEIEIFATSLTTQTYTVTTRHGSTTEVFTGTTAVDLTSSPALAVTGQNGTASANDIVCDGFEAIRAAS